MYIQVIDQQLLLNRNIDTVVWFDKKHSMQVCTMFLWNYNYENIWRVFLN